MQDYSYFVNQLNFLRKIITNRTKTTWIVVYVQNYQTEIKVQKIISDEFTDFKTDTIDISEIPNDTKIYQFIDSKIDKKNDLNEKYLKNLVFLSGTSKILGEEKGKSFIQKLNFERESLFHNFSKIFVLFVLKSYKSHLQTQAPDFWDWLQYHTEFEIAEQLQDSRLEISQMLNSNISSKQEADKNIEKLNKIKEDLLNNNYLSEKRKNTAIVNTNFQLIDNYIFNANYNTALDLATETEKYFADIEDDLILVELWSKFVDIYFYLQNLDKSLFFSKKIIETQLKYFEKEHPSLATSYNNISLIYKDKGDYEQALEFALKSIKIKEKVPENEKSDLATSYSNISLIFQDKGDFEHALEFALKSIIIYEKVFGNEHPNLATSYNNISMIYRDKGDYEQALEFALKSLKIKEKVLGNEHPSLATSCNNISLIYYDLKNKKTAYDYICKAVEIMEKKLPANHPNLINAIEFKKWLENELIS